MSDRPAVLYACIHNSGRSVAEHVPTLLEATIVEGADVVVTMGCEETCPICPGKRYEDWAVDDPAGQDAATVRRIVADIDTRVRRLLNEFAPNLTLPAPVLVPRL